jgi:hypothetical protein
MVTYDHGGDLNAMQRHTERYMFAAGGGGGEG